jgi:hypothetical protein
MPLLVCYYTSKHGLLIVAHRGQFPGSPGGLIIVAHLLLCKLSEGLR